MSLTYKEAVDDISKLINDVFPHTLYWESVQKDREAPAEDPFGDVTIRHATGRQTSLGSVGSRDFMRIGLIILEIYTPVGKGLSVAYELARLSANAYEGVTSPNGVWFRNARIQEIGRDGEFHQINVLVDFEYHETK